MEAWSEELPNDFLARLFLDTNILCYYLDSEYPSLNESLDLLFDSQFVALLSSHAVLLELASLRKRLHYFRRVLNYFPHIYSRGSDDTKKLWGKINNYKDCPELAYNCVRDDVKRTVLREINDLRESCPQIDFEYSKYHEGLYEPAANLVLSSNFSRHDSMVFVSALLPLKDQPESGLYFTTKDKDLVTHTSDAELRQLCNDLGLFRPMAERITSLRDIPNRTVNLTKPISSATIKTFWAFKILELLKFRNADYYIGATTAPITTGWPDNAVPFKLEKGCTLKPGASLVVIGKDLDFVYNIKVPINEYRNLGPPLTLPFTATEKTKLSFLSFDYDSGVIVPTSATIIARLREAGHLIFINPDSP